MRQRSSTTQPCSVTEWPTVTQSPTITGHLVQHSVQHAAILNIAVRANADEVHIAAQHGVHPHAGVFSQHHIADQLRRLVDIAGRRHRGRVSLVGADHVSSSRNLRKPSPAGEKWRPAWPPLNPEVVQHSAHWEKSYRVSKCLKIPCRECGAKGRLRRNPESGWWTGCPGHSPTHASPSRSTARPSRADPQAAAGQIKIRQVWYQTDDYEVASLNSPRAEIAR
jgi:hypothetical protein